MRPHPRRSLPDARLSCANGVSNVARWPPAWRRQAIACSPSLACRRANGKVPEPPTPSSACTRSSSDASRPRPCCLRRKPPPCSFGHCWHPAKSPCARSTAGRHWPSPLPINRLILPPDRVLSCLPAITPPIDSNTIRYGTRLGMGSLTKIVLSFDEPFWPPRQYAFGHLSSDILRTPTLIVNLWRTHK